MPEPFVAKASDGYAIKGRLWRNLENKGAARPVVIINPATSVACRYYARFAGFLFESGFDVIIYDYRGIGESRPANLRGFEAGWIDWGRLDFEAVLQFAGRSFPDQPIDVVGHSIGGGLIGLAKSNHRIRRIFTVGAQYAYWRDYAAARRLRMVAKWHIAMPLLTIAFGYFPGKKLGWLEDTPKGVVWDWVLSRARFEDTWRGFSSTHTVCIKPLVQQFAAVTAPILAVSVTDDEYGTIPAIERLLAYFNHSRRLHLRISPEAIAEPAIGHFGFFNSRFQQKLWQLPLGWLKCGRVPSDAPGTILASGEAASDIAKINPEPRQA